MHCPVCGDEYQPGVTQCVDCEVALTDDPGAPAPEAVPDDELLGRFHPRAAEPVVALLERRRIRHETFPLDDEVEVVVDGDYRDDLRAELLVNWSELVGRIPQDEVWDVLAEGGNLPGWRDAPEAAWVDRDGRMQVADEQEDVERDATRVVGPGLVTAGIVLVVLGWFASGTLDNTATLLVVVGIGSAVLGLFLPR